MPISSVGVRHTFNQWHWWIPVGLIVLLYYLLPLITTLLFSFTNIDGGHSLSFEQAQAYLAKHQYPNKQLGEYTSALYPGTQPETVELVLTDSSGKSLISPPLTLLDAQTIRQQRQADHEFILPYTDKPLPLTPLQQKPTREPLSIRSVVSFREHLLALTFLAPGMVLPNDLRMSGLRKFHVFSSKYQAVEPPVLVNGKHINIQPLYLDISTDRYFAPDTQTGEFRYIDQQQAAPQKQAALAPGFIVPVGAKQYASLLTSGQGDTPTVLARVLRWQLIRALATTVICLLLAAPIAAKLMQPNLKGRPIYLTVLLLPLAIPHYVSSTAAKGIFNQHFGELNLLLATVLESTPNWFTEPGLARLMLLIVQLWQLLPWAVLLFALQLFKTPAQRHPSLHSGRLTRDTLHLLWPLAKLLLVLMPLYICGDIALIKQLSGGHPDYIGAIIPAGFSDTISHVSYRLNFEGGMGYNYGQGMALSLLQLPLIAILAVWLWRLAPTNQAQMHNGSASAPAPTAPTWQGHLMLLLNSLWVLLPIVAVSLVAFRQNNFASQLTDYQLSLDHFRLALGQVIPESGCVEDCGVVPPPFPVLQWGLNSLIQGFYCALFVTPVALLCTYAAQRLRLSAKQLLLLGALPLLLPMSSYLAVIYLGFTRLTDVSPWWMQHTDLIIAGLLLSISLPLSALLTGLNGKSSRQTHFRYQCSSVAIVALSALLWGIREQNLSSLLYANLNDYTLGVGLTQYLYPCNYLWGYFSAAALLTTLPTIAIFYLLAWFVWRRLSATRSQ